MKVLRRVLLWARRGNDRRDRTSRGRVDVDAEDLAPPLAEAVPERSGPGADRRVEKVFALLVLGGNGRRRNFDKSVVSGFDRRSMGASLRTSRAKRLMSSSQADVRSGQASLALIPLGFRLYGGRLSS